MREAGTPVLIKIFATPPKIRMKKAHCLVHPNTIA
jgi:hypothetical protein